MALYTNVPGLAAIAGRDRQLLFHCAEDRARSADETLLLLLLLLLLCVQMGESLQVVCSSGM